MSESEELKLMIKAVWKSVVLDMDDLGRLAALAMYVDEKTPDDMREILRSQVLD